VSAAQSILTSQNKLLQVEVEAKQAQAVAIGKANATIAEAEGQAKAIQIVTEAQVAANQKINDSLSPEVLKYLMIDRMNKNVQVWVVPDSQNISILPNTK
jgi:regulator of protease activity HflC (stomatin/prohibitin superfamily)